MNKSENRYKADRLIAGVPAWVVTTARVGGGPGNVSLKFRQVLVLYTGRIQYNNIYNVLKQTQRYYNLLNLCTIDNVFFTLVIYQSFVRYSIQFNSNNLLTGGIYSVLI